MRTEARLFAGGALFFTITGLLYWLVSSESAGATMLAACVVAFAFVGVYLLVIGRRIGLRPEDRPDATPADGAGDLGYFPSASVWPFALSLGAVLVALGIVFSGALIGLGVIILGISVVGFAGDAAAKP